MQMYNCTTLITLHGINNLLAKDGHQPCCQKRQYIQNWSCVKN